MSDQDDQSDQPDLTDEEHGLAEDLVAEPLRLAATIRKQYTRYIVFHSEVRDEEADTLTLWTLHTHAFGAAETTPYIAIMAPTEEAGKSKIMEVADYLARESTVIADPTASSLFRMIDAADSPAILIDEVDVLYKSKPLRAVLNQGYRFGGTVTRSVPDAKKGYVAKKFNVFCPKMFAGIAGRQLPITGATLSRCIQIPMQRRVSSEPIEKFRHRQVRRDSVPIYVALVRWSEKKVAKLSNANPRMPKGLSDRQEECWEPLFAIADDLGGDWPQRARRAAVRLTERLVKQPSELLALMVDLKRAWDDIDGSRAHTHTLAEKMATLDDRLYEDTLSAQELSQLISRFGIRPEKNPFMLHGTLRRGYKRSAFQDAFRRYVS